MLTGSQALDHGNFPKSQVRLSLGQQPHREPVSLRESPQVLKGVQSPSAHLRNQNQPRSRTLTSFSPSWFNSGLRCDKNRPNASAVRGWSSR